MCVKRIKVFIIEDNSVLSAIIKESLANNFKSGSFWIFTSVEEAMAQVSELPDYVILDHFLNKSNGVDCLPVIREFLPKSKILVVSEQKSIKTFENAFVYGANAYLEKEGDFVYKIINFINDDIEKKAKRWYNSIVNVLSPGSSEEKRKKIVYVLEDKTDIGFSVKLNYQDSEETNISNFSLLSEFLDKVNVNKPDYVILNREIKIEKKGDGLLDYFKSVSPDTKIILFSDNNEISHASFMINSGVSFYFTRTDENITRLKKIIN